MRKNSLSIDENRRILPFSPFQTSLFIATEVRATDGNHTSPSDEISVAHHTYVISPRGFESKFKYLNTWNTALYEFNYQFQLKQHRRAGIFHSCLHGSEMF